MRPALATALLVALAAPGALAPRAAGAAPGSACRLPPPAVAHASWLQAREETFRAAGVYLEALRLSPTNGTKVEALRCLAGLYMDAGRFRRAAATLYEAGALVEPGGGFGAQLALNTATAAIHADNPAGALALLRGLKEGEGGRWRPRAELLRGLAEAGLGRYDAAAARFESATRVCESRDPRPACRVARRNTLLIGARPGSTSGLLAAALSAVVPGAGFVYTEHYFDALLYATSVGLAAFVAADSWRVERDALDQRAGTYTLIGLGVLLYTSNVLSSYNTAERLDRVRDDAFGRRLRVGTRLPLLPMSATPTAP